LKNKIFAAVDFFYPLFKKIMPLHVFTYALCGAINVCLDLLTFYVSYNLILKGNLLHLGFHTFKPHIAAYFMSFCVTFPVGFLLSKYIVWFESNIPGTVQLYRYFFLVISNILINIFFLKFFIEVLYFPPILAKVFTIFVVICFSYVNQKYFTFKIK
jgi:putative flippase GtrA